MSTLSLVSRKMSLNSQRVSHARWA